jgi:hypothetical protein
VDLNTRLRDESLDSMTDELAIRHKTYTIALTSYRSDGLWVPTATVRGPSNDEKGKRVIQDLADPSPTRDGADATAKKLAIEWIDSQFPSVAH